MCRKYTARSTHTRAAAPAVNTHTIPTQPTQYPHEILYNPIDKPRRDSKTQYMLMRVGFTSKRDIQNFRAVGNLLRAQRDRLFAAVNALTKSEDFLSELHEQRELKKRNPSRLQPLALGLAHSLMLQHCCIWSHGGGQRWLCWTYRTGQRRVTLVLRGSLCMGTSSMMVESHMCMYKQ